MNKVILVGNVVKDVDYRQNNGSGTARYTIACKRDYKNRDGQYDSDFINCVAWGKTADFAVNHLKKGTKIAVTGSVLTGSYTNKDGQKVYTTEVKVDGHEFVEKASDRASAEQTSMDATPTSSTSVDGFMDIPDSEAGAVFN